MGRFQGGLEWGHSLEGGALKALGGALGASVRTLRGVLTFRGSPRSWGGGGYSLEGGSSGGSEGLCEDPEGVLTFGVGCPHGGGWL